MLCRWLLCAVGDELKTAIKRQVEFYFSKANLATDAFLVSQMNSQMYVLAIAAVEALPQSAFVCELL